MSQVVASLLIIFIALLGFGVMVGAVKVQDVSGKIFGVVLVAIFGSIGIKIIESVFESLSFKFQSSGVSVVTVIICIAIFFIIIKWLGVYKPGGGSNR